MESDEIITPTVKYKGISVKQIAVSDNIITQGEKKSNQLKDVTNIYNKGHMKQQQHEQFDCNNNYKSIIRQRSQQNFYNRTAHDSSLSAYSSINTINRIYPATALAGEISDVEDDEGQLITRGTPGTTTNKLKDDDNIKLPTNSSFLAEETISSINEQLTKSNQLEARIVRYPNGRPLAINIIHKVYVVELEGAYAWVRLYNGNRPPCFDASHVTLKAMKALDWDELLPGTPCVVLARFNPLDIVNDGIARELTQFESYARAVIEECHQMTKTVTVRLVDFGFRLTQLSAEAIKPLTIAFDGPPLALRLKIDSLSKQQKESLCRYVVLGVRLTISRDKQKFLCWSKTWKAIDIKVQNWNQRESDCSSSIISSEMHNSNNQHYASSSSGLVKRAFVSSWLNKKHKKAGGPGIEAALREIGQRHSG
uniref:Tudor domain-containing protein n=1 Tax=Onchocerca volvulus TaxID=6282 RepID=A0A8R1XR87_ONCVO